MAFGDTLIRHATSPIEFGDSKLHRERLVDLIHQNLPGKLIAIGAPAGYGKTTLLADFAQHSSIPVCWVRLSSVERDVFRLAEILASSLQRRFRRLRGEPDLNRLSGASPEALARIFLELIEEKIPEPFVIALDDVQEINQSSHVLKFLDVFIQELPEQATVLAAGREIINVSLARLMAEGSLAGIGPKDMAFSWQEMEELVNHVIHADLSKDELETLYARTRGWITGVLLSNQITRDGLEAVIKSSGSVVYEYLVSVVLDHLSDDVRKFLLESSVLPVMTAEACDRILGRDDSNEQLRSLVDRSLFISVTHDSPRSYEYHPQFRTFLSTYFKEHDKQRMEALRRKAGAIYEENGGIEHAVNLYMDAGEWDAASRLAEKNARQMFISGRGATLREWRRRFQQKDVSIPFICLYLAKIYTDKGELDIARENLLDAIQMAGSGASSWFRAQLANQSALLALKQGDYETVWSSASEAESFSRCEGGEENLASSLRIRAYSLLLQKRELDKAEAMAMEAVQLLESSGESYDLALLYSDLSTIQASRGKNVESQRTCRKAHEILQERGAPVPLALSYNNMAYFSYMRGDYQEALNLFLDGLKFARRGGSMAREANILYGIGDLFNDLGLAFHAGQHYANGLEIATKLDSNQLISYGCLGTSILHRRSGNGNLPHEWLQRAVSLGSYKHIPSSIRIQIAALEISDNPEAARGTLAHLLGEENRVTAVEHTTALFFYARALLAEQRLLEAVEQFNGLLDWADSHGTQQALAAELLHDKGMKEFYTKYMGHHSAYETVMHRMEKIKAFARQYTNKPEENEAAPGLVVTAMGTCTIRHAGKPVESIKPLDKELFIFLLDRKRVERDVILEEFWPDASPGKKVASLYTAVYNLRQHVGKEAILLDDSMYLINPELTLEFDLHRFERAAGIAEQMRTGDPRRYFALTDAVDQYGGTFFMESDSDWVITRRRSIEGRYLELLLDHSEEALIHDHASRAVDSLRKALSIDPYRDDLNHRYLEALGRLERRSEIVSHYQQYIHLLSNDLGLDPPDSVRKLYSRLLG